ncbi:unnamed protein product [Plutella xylostella]|uniref:(diamondback moth) hypothetical protein n=1 Tax=Plutella xylostella TaxID=51655 RepID=A0A8S4DBD9_PLUXY|nr:unnamed protein product [Plutella xylostella]
MRCTVQARAAPAAARPAGTATTVGTSAGTRTPHAVGAGNGAI